MPACMSVQCACAVLSEARRGHWTLWSWSDSPLLAALRVLGAARALTAKPSLHPLPVDRWELPVYLELLPLYHIWGRLCIVPHDQSIAASCAVQEPVGSVH